MSNLHGNASIADSTLLFCIDASNQASYPGGGNNVYDISGNENHATSVTASISWQPQNSGRFYFDGSGGSALHVGSTMTTGTVGTSFEVWMYRINNASSLYIWDARQDAGTWMFTNYLSYNFNWSTAVIYNDPVTYQTNSNQWDQWIHFVAYTNPGIGAGYYINGVNVEDDNVFPDDDIGANFRIGTRYTYGNHFYGYMGLFRIYNRKLTDAEVNQNFNATRWRFGV